MRAAGAAPRYPHAPGAQGKAAAFLTELLRARRAPASDGTHPSEGKDGKSSQLSPGRDPALPISPQPRAGLHPVTGASGLPDPLPDTTSDKALGLTGLTPSRSCSRARQEEASPPPSPCSHQTPFPFLSLSGHLANAAAEELGASGSKLNSTVPPTSGAPPAQTDRAPSVPQYRL